MISGTASLVGTIGFDLIGGDLGKDVEFALQNALEGGVLFANAATPLSIFREALATSICAIQTHKRGQLFQEFLLKGPYDDSGEIPIETIGQYLSDAETATVITFVYSHMVNCFKGAVTELLASNACLRLLKQLQRDGELPANAGLYIGDVVGVHRSKGKGLLKGADAHILIKQESRGKPVICVAGVAEVKSYFRSKHLLCNQLQRHLERSKAGMQLAGEDFPGDHVRIGYGPESRAVKITVIPDDWALPRTFWFENTGNGRILHSDPGVPPRKEDEIMKSGDDEWRITLRWSKEALAAAAYDMTFWYMEKVGEVIYSQSKPKGWEKRSAGDAGRNAAKMMIYYAILRCRTARESQRAIALYNSYGFGYALGMNYRNAEGRREMLWPQDLDEIAADGKTKDGGSIH